MGQALYRKHRPKSLKEVVGQKHITETLEKALKQGRISHAYLFTGPRGVGKTSVARILAHELNGLPYTDDSAHIDIIEIDAASNRRIDEIRELRDKVYIAPTSAKYKVYIIDEVHMLTREAFNALLKTLEEPPAHVVFILATTDPHKLPDTIISRTQRFSFKPGEKTSVSTLLQAVAEQEKLKISAEALDLLAEHSDGSFRDSLSLLDQARGHTAKLEVADVQTLLGIPSVQALTELLHIISEGGKPAAVMTRLTRLYDQGYQATVIAKQLGQLLREQLANNQLGLSHEATLNLLEKLISVPAAYNPERWLEITLLQATPVGLQATVEATVDEPEPEASLSPEVPEPPIAEEVMIETTLQMTKTKPSSATSEIDQAMVDKVWPELLGSLKQQHNTLYGVVRMAQPVLSDKGVLQLGFSFAFHQKRVNETANRQILSKLVQELAGQPIIIECVVDKAAVPAKVSIKRAEKPVEPQLQAISNIFGGGELLD